VSGRGQGRLAEAQRYFEQRLTIAHETQYAELGNDARGNLLGLSAQQDEPEDAQR
jgi:hypothetical protein